MKKRSLCPKSPGLGTLFSILGNFCKNGECVYSLTIHPHLKVQMIPRAVSGTADITDHLTLPHGLTGYHTNLGTVGIQGVICLIMLHLNEVPIAAAPRVGGISKSDGAVCGSQDRRPFRRGNIGADVGADFPRNGVDTLAKTGFVVVCSFSQSSV